MYIQNLYNLNIKKKSQLVNYSAYRVTARAPTIMATAMMGTRNPEAPPVIGGEVVSGLHVLHGVSLGFVTVVMVPLVPETVVGTDPGAVAIEVIPGWVSAAVVSAGG